MIKENTLRILGIKIKRFECPIPNCKCGRKAIKNLKNHIIMCAKIGDVAHQHEAKKLGLKF